MPYGSSSHLLAFFMLFNPRISPAVDMLDVRKCRPSLCQRPFSFLRRIVLDMLKPHVD